MRGDKVSLVRVHGDLVLTEHAMMSELGHPIIKQLLRLHLSHDKSEPSKCFCCVCVSM